MATTEATTAGHWRTLLDSDVIRYVDLQDREFTLQIKSIKGKQKITGSGGKSGSKAMIYFEGKNREKPLAAGTAILTQIAALYGNDTRKWIGQWITLWPDPSVMYAGARVGGVRVRNVVPGPVTPAAEPPKDGSND